MKIDRSNPRHWILLAQQGIYTFIAVLLRFLKPKPDKPIVILYGHQFSGNLRALYQQWEVSHGDKMTLFFMSLDTDQSAELKARGINALRCTSFKEMMKISEATALISDHGLHAMAHLLRFTDIVFVDVWHGIPFKGFIPADFHLQHNYNQVWVSSGLLKVIYQDKFGFPPRIVHNLGYARTDKLFRRESPDPELREKLAIPTGHRIVLFAPTWQQDHLGREMFPFGESQRAFLQKLSEVCNQNQSTLVIRSHQNASIDSENIDNVRYCAMRDYPDTEALLLHTDILLCDWSSIAFDFLALNRPTVFLDVKPPFKNGLSLGKEFRFGAIVSDMMSLENDLGYILADPDTYFEKYATKHEEVCSKVYGENTEGLSAHNQLDHLGGLINAGRAISYDH